MARNEIPMLESLRAIDERTVIIHGVATGPQGLEILRRHHAALIWCPTSNLRMLGRTVTRAVLDSGIPVALGTDSALTAPVDLLDELHAARKYVSAVRLFEMVTIGAARILRLAKSWRTQDWIAVRTNSKIPARALFDGKIELVVVAGRIRLISPELAEQLPAGFRHGFQSLTLEGRPTVLVDADVKSLYRAASKHLGKDLRLAGKRILL